MGKSRILVVGATGNLGHHLVNASLAYDHPTFALVRDSAFSDPHKSHLINSLIESGVHLIKGSLQDQATLIEAIKQVDVVICAVSSNQVLDQKLLIQAIKEVGCIKRFIPSEFGVDPDKVQISDLAQNFYSNKVEIRRIIEKEGIPYTFISCNLFAGYLLPSLVQPGLKNPPRDKIRIFGDGNTKAVFVKVCDVASFTISTVEDPRTLNKVLYLRPPGNVYSMNELVEIWEMKIGKKLEKVYIPEEEVLKIIQGSGQLVLWMLKESKLLIWDKCTWLGLCNVRDRLAWGRQPVECCLGLHRCWLDNQRGKKVRVCRMDGVRS